MKPLGKLYMIPLPIVDGALQTLSPEVRTETVHIKHFFAENARTGRRFIKLLHPTLVIDTLQFSEIDKHTGADTKLLLDWLKEGSDVGVMSEAGCPGIADPGAILAGIAHTIGAHVVPLTGPSSLILALMASGLNGQSFCFKGYIPVKEPARGQYIKAMENASRKEQQTQLFIETPYRNNNMLNDLVKNCNGNTRLCIAESIGAPDAFIKTQTIDEWKKNQPDLKKAPAVFLLLAR
ncbi:MAG: SAM-dependent methyltransferase [Taibaiella sp.]|nr:SAM-dependent methyltransferase [Taibaiella sp.]